MDTVTAILIGAGGRGVSYSFFALDNPGLLKMVGIAEPSKIRRDEFVESHKIPEDNIYTTWEDILSRDKFADTAFICTQDRMHYQPVIAAIEKGYDILLEKPISPFPEECIEIARAAKAKGVKVVVCHVLRYTPFFSTIKEVIDSGAIGEIVSIVHNENVGNLHQSHSFVRGNWRNSNESAPMILAKSCHDVDIVQWLIGTGCERVSSFGSLAHFTDANKPEGAPAYCLDGCPHEKTCPYHVDKAYFNHYKEQRWMYLAVAGFSNATGDDLREALRKGPYGRCVFQCDNNVVDHQIVNMQFENNVTVAFTMCAFTPQTSRDIKIMGTKGQIKGYMEDEEIILTDFLSYKETLIKASLQDGRDGHGGGDAGIMEAFCAYIKGTYKGNKISEADISAKNHMIAFAAEESRLKGGEVVIL